MSGSRVAEAARDYGPLLDKACTVACGNMWRRGGYSDYELREGYKELRKLSSGRDLAYDRPSIGLHYALWYHLQRTHLLAQALIPLLVGNRRPWTIYDIGCGTGATAWAVAVITRACLDSDVPVPRVEVYGFDTSPFMLETAEHLWDALPENLKSSVITINILGSWNRQPIDTNDHSHKLVVCSYLFNTSDYKHMNDIDAGLTRFSDHVGTDRILSISPRRKTHLVNALLKSNWRAEPFQPHDYQLWGGIPDYTAALRRRLLKKANVTDGGDPSWNPTTAPSYHLVVRTHSELYPVHYLWDEINDEQDRASVPEERLTALVGPAGSGKSVVLVERMVRVIESARYEPPSILVTSFNKAMVEQLITWTCDRIKFSETVTIVPSSDRGRRGDADWTILARNSFGAKATIWFLNWDKLPTRVWQTPSDTFNPFEEPPDSRYSSKVSFDDQDHRSWTTNELELVVYGQEVMSYERYIDTARTRRRGRRTSLTCETRIRIWPQIMAAAKLPKNVFLYRRMSAWSYNKLARESGQQMMLRPRFGDVTHVFVDEVQDLTRADIRMLAHTPPRPQRLFITGDSTQAIHTHGICPRPAIRRAAWKKVRLSGSYRLPALACTALADMADTILRQQRSRNAGGDGRLPQVSRSAVPGPRPIILNGTNLKTTAEPLTTMSRFISSENRSDLVWNVVQENRSSGSLRLLRLACQRIRKLSMLKHKGLERSLVIFPTDVQPPDGKSVLEWVYAAFTRAAAVLVIAVFPDETHPQVAEALSKLKEEHLMFWDAAAKDAWSTMIGP